MYVKFSNCGLNSSISKEKPTYVHSYYTYLFNSAVSIVDWTV